MSYPGWPAWGAGQQVVPEPSNAPVSPSKRASEPRSWTPFTNGGAGLVPRRGVPNALEYQTFEGLSNLSRAPQEMLSVLPAIHPTVGLAEWTALRLMFPKKGSWGFRAFKPAAGTGTLDKPWQQGDRDDEADASIIAMLDGLAREVQGLRGLCCTAAKQLFYTGMACAEVVGYTDGEAQTAFPGAKRIWPVESQTIAFGRFTRDGDLVPFQLQKWPTTTTPGGGYGWSSMWHPMPLARFFWKSVDPDVDQPYGTPVYSASLNEALADIALIRDLRDAVHNSAWPRLDVGLNLSELHRVAVEVYNIKDPKKATAWVNARFAEVVAYVQNLAPDDNLVHDSTGRVETKQPGSFAGMQGVLEFLRNRLVQALKSLPTLMGIGEGTVNVSSVEWAVYAGGLEALRDLILELYADALNCHLQMAGSTSHVVAYAEDIRSNDRLVSANTKEVMIRNAAAMEGLGYIDHDAASELVTGEKAKGTAIPGAVDAVLGIAAQADGDQSRKSGNAGQGGNTGNNEGTSKDNKDAGGTK